MTSSPSVAIDVGALHGPQTGVGQFVARLIEGLATLDDPPDLRPYVLSFRAPLQPGVRRLRYPAGLALRSWGVCGLPRADRALAGAEVVHGPNYIVPPSRLPTVVSVHDCWFLERPHEVTGSVRLFGAVLRRAVRRGVTVHVPSHHTATQVRELLGAERVAIVPLGSPVVLPPGAPIHLAGLDGRPYVLALGAKEPRKNLPRLIDAFGLLQRELPDMALVLLGPDGPDQPAIDAAIARQPRPAAERIMLIDYVSDDDRNAIVHGAAALAYPSLDEGFGFPALEAMAAGVPVVAADAGSLPEVCGEAAILVNPRNPASMAAGLHRVIVDSTVRAEAIALGHERTEVFSVARAAQGMAALYRDVAREGKAVITVLSGGVGAARMLVGFQEVIDPALLTAVVNVGDDTVLHGLSISPDLDTITYTLAGAIDPERGWGLVDETWRVMASLERFAAVRPPGSGAGATWFGLGDQDLATHLYRTHRLDEGASLTEVTAEIVAAYGVGVRLLPVTDDPVRTTLTVAGEGEIGFQEYFVGRRHQVPITGVRFAGADAARMGSGVGAAIEEAEVLVIAPSNPIVSIAPLLAVPGVRECVARAAARAVAVSPIVGGKALKGPADRMLAELGHPVSVVGVARLYRGLAATLVIDARDADLAAEVEREGLRCVVTDTVMRTPEVAAALAEAVLGAAVGGGS